jgi:hypothetical protein
LHPALAAVKWRQFKLHFVEYSNQPGHRYRIDLGTPQLFNVAFDPKELWDIMEPNTWIIQATAPVLKAYNESVCKFPHVPTGGDGPAASTPRRPLTPRG